MKNQPFKLVFIITFILTLVFFAIIMRGQEIPKNDPVTCSILDKIDENDSELAGIKLKIGNIKYSYEESRIFRNPDGSVSSISKVKFSEPEKEIALMLLNIRTCRTEIIKVSKRGDRLIVPAGYDIRPVERASGLTWNAFNTQYEVLKPDSTIVLKNAWPKMDAKKHINNIVYSLYSADNEKTAEIEPGIHFPEIVSEGAERLKRIVTEARDRLRSRKVYSKTFSDQIAGDLPFLPPEVYESLLMIEQSDYNEFLYDRRKTMERVLVILRANKERAFASCNSTKPSKACGAFQFTDRSGFIKVRGKKVRVSGTYSTIVSRNRNAKLINSFPEGAFDHVNSAMLAILLHDNNLNLLFSIFGEKIIEDPALLAEALAGCYNGSPRWTILSLEEYFDGNIDDWTKSRYLRKETKEYIEKHRYVRSEF